MPGFLGGLQAGQDGEVRLGVAKGQKKLQDTINQGPETPFYRPSKRTCGRSEGIGCGEHVSTVSGFLRLRATWPSIVLVDVELRRQGSGGGES